MGGNYQNLSEKEDKRCPHLPPPEEEERLLDFRDQILVRDPNNYDVL
jgi:chromosome transmission fidelity protein 1